jgi:hypothetical protein
MSDNLQQVDRISQEQLYKNVAGFLSIAKLKSFLEALTNSPINPGAHVKSLKLCALSRYIFSEDGGFASKIVSTVAKCCPKLEFSVHPIIMNSRKN